MTASKRKNNSPDHGTMNQGPKMVIVGNNNVVEEDEENQWIANTMDRMKQLRMKWQQHNISLLASPNSTNTTEEEEEDPIALALQSVHHGDHEPEERLVAQAQRIQDKLSHEIDRAKALCNQESSVLVQLASQLAKFQEQRKALLEEIDALDEQQRASQKQIAIYQEEASQGLDMVSDIEQEKKRQVPRLKATISLYATTTGIKWDFSDPDILSGQVVSYDISAFVRERCVMRLPQSCVHRWINGIQPYQFLLTPFLSITGCPISKGIQTFLDRSS
jgi:DNA polymerase III alpha subunit